jgi:hypothetical protein
MLIDNFLESGGRLWTVGLWTNEFITKSMPQQVMANNLHVIDFLILFPQIAQEFRNCKVL